MEKKEGGKKEPQKRKNFVVVGIQVPYEEDPNIVRDYEVFSTKTGIPASKFSKR